MSKNCGHTVPCGCADEPLTTAPSCDQPNCPDPEPCPETFCAHCVVWCGDGIVELGIEQGMRLDVIMQQLALVINNPNCASSTADSPCTAPLGIASSNVGSTSMDISWPALAVPPAQYQVEYKPANSFSWIVNGPINPVGGEVSFTDSIMGLMPNTDYHIRVLAICNDTEACYSVTILVRTQNQ